MAIVSTLTLEEALARGLQLWPVVFDKWGDMGAGSTFSSISLPTTSIFGAAIMPGSSVHAVKIAYEPRFGVVTPVTDVLQDNEIILTSGCPLRAALPGGITVKPIAQERYGDVVFTDVGGTMPFGSAEPLFRPPVLRMMFFLNAGVQVDIGRRSVDVRENISATLAVGVEQLVTVLPISGKKHLRIMGSAGASNVSMRITGVSGTVRFGVPSPDQLVEFPLTTLAVPPSSRTSVEIDNPNAQFVIIRATAADATIGFRVDTRAED